MERRRISCFKLERTFSGIYSTLKNLFSKPRFRSEKQTEK
ncbi:hypothetical protein LEP1GSC185_3264 [Leptospira licerasiae serovar Varillal str. VAR 010]|uniref:Uncharacterized protein n=1 Tax=Leptospira licerasiae str. MMD4847 TaxID=1049971 RepID=A0ABP2RDQ0_9LEPT|nr:hypothetical protein LEP1GSC185_3264 [Leptospira licerasiae serovar Varillal str. VAR 010]EJZ42616.1 hypothetical protein LEP1GSC178_2880 [Leptospira licerasiae str. MMD4847]